MALADHFSRPEMHRPAKLPDRRCPACEALYQDAEEWARKAEAAEAEAEAMKQMALAEEAKLNQLLHQIASRNPEET